MNCVAPETLTWSLWSRSPEVWAAAVLWDNRAAQRITQSQSCQRCNTVCLAISPWYGWRVLSASVNGPCQIGGMTTTWEECTYLLQLRCSLIHLCSRDHNKDPGLAILVLVLQRKSSNNTSTRDISISMYIALPGIMARWKASESSKQAKHTIRKVRWKGSEGSKQAKHTIRMVGSLERAGGPKTSETYHSEAFEWHTSLVLSYLTHSNEGGMSPLQCDFGGAG